MALKSLAFSLLAFLKPSSGAAQPLAPENGGSPASPRTPICEVGLEEHQRKQQHQRLFIVSPPIAPFTASVEKELTSGLIDPASFLIEKLEKGWFEENVVDISGWWDICSGNLSWPGGGGQEGEGGGGQGWQRQPTTSDLMAWVPKNLSDSEPSLGPPLRIRTSNLGSSNQLHLFPTIEMASTSGSSAPFSTANRDAAGLPRSRLRRLPRVFSDNNISFSDGEQSHRPRSSRIHADYIPVALPQFSDKQSKIRNSTKVEKPAGKLEAGSSDRERRMVQKHHNSSLPGAPTRRRRKTRKKKSSSLTQSEYDEFSADFNSTRDNKTPRVTKEFPGLKFYTDGDGSREQSPNRSSHQSRLRSPKEWTRSSNSLLLKGHLPSNNSSDVDIKAHLKFWAHSVASTVSAEC